MSPFSVFDGVPLGKMRFVERIKLQLGVLFLWPAMRLIPLPFWEEFAVQVYGEVTGEREQAEQRRAELEARVAEIRRRTRK